MKAVLLALRFGGIQILFLRRTYAELRENHLLPLLRILKDAAVFREADKSFFFPNSSRIRLGYCDGERDVLQHQGQAYDVIFLEEATQFTEFQFQVFTECLRASGQMREPFSPRMYLTCNPGGVGHGWVKRLFIDRDYKKAERPEDYRFIQSLVYDNRFLMERSPEYVRSLENLPENRRRAMLLGDWDVFEGQYFPEFSRELHVAGPFVIPAHWRRYRALDYGLDMLACYWAALDDSGRAWIYRELYRSGLIISEAAKSIAAMTPPEEEIDATFAPPDLWNRRQDSGKSAALLFAEHGVPLAKASNDRVSGWLELKEWLKPAGLSGELSPGLRIFSNCKNLIRCLPQIQADPVNPNDCASSPHELTHSCDALRYFVAGRPAPAESAAENPFEPPEELGEFLSYGEG